MILCRVSGLTFDFLLKICFSILCPIRNSNLSIVSAYPPSGRNMVTFMNLKNSKLVMVKFIWQLLFWHSYRRLLSQKRKSASWDISYTLKERRISVPSKGRKKIVQNIKTYLFLIWFVFYPLYSRNTKKLKKLKSWIFYKQQWYFSQIV